MKKRTIGVFLGNLSIRRKLFFSLLLVCLLLVALITVLSLGASVTPLREALMDTNMARVTLIQDRLDSCLSEWTNRCYALEIDTAAKEALTRWCATDTELNYTDKRLFIEELYTVLTNHREMTCLSLYNLTQGVCLEVRRSGGTTGQTGDRLAAWQTRKAHMQTNIALLPGDHELLLFHQIDRFEDGMPLAVLVMHINKDTIVKTLTEGVDLNDSTLIALNDAGQTLLRAGGGDLAMTQADIDAHLPFFESLGEKGGRYEAHSVFYASVQRGKARLLSFLPESAVESVVRRVMGNGLMMASIALVLATLMSALLSRLISGPIEALAERMRHTTILTYQTGGEQRRTDEIGSLMTAFETMMTRDREWVRRSYESELARRTAQMGALRAQINPHFMYNALQVIGAMALDQGAPGIYPLTTALSDIMRYAISSGPEMVPLRDELTYLNAYLSIQNARFDGNVTFETHIAPELMTAPVPKLILQPVIENCFAHGLSDQEGPWRITLSAERREGLMLLRVQDNGRGMSGNLLNAMRARLECDAEAVLDSDGHIGLANVSARLRLRGGPACGVRLENGQSGGLVVTLIIREEHDSRALPSEHP